MRNNFNFTGEGLAKELRLHLTHKERMEECRESTSWTLARVAGWLPALWRRIRLGKRKLYLVRFQYGNNTGGNILRAFSPRDACVQLVPFLSDYSHHCRNPYYNTDCAECVKAWEEMAERMNAADVTWLGWPQPKWNWVIPV